MVEPRSLIEVPAAMSSFEEVMHFAETAIGDFDISRKEEFRFYLCIEEIFTNIAKYAYQNAISKDHDDELYASKAVRISIDTNSESLPHSATVTFEDAGVPYNPLEQDFGGQSSLFDIRKVDGLAIYVIRQIMTDLNYERVSGHNVFTMIKNFE